MARTTGVLNGVALITLLMVAHTSWGQKLISRTRMGLGGADVRQQLGDRIPNKPDWLESDGSADVRAAAATIVSAPVVMATESG